MTIRKRTLIFLALILLILGGGIYTYLVYHGYVLLNNPSRKRYPVVGVDLSHYQGDVDWEVLSEQDIQFAYVKATEGSSHVDSQFSRNWEGAKHVDLMAGAYHFFSFDSPGETQADNFIREVAGYEGMLPPAVDVEYYADKKNNPPEAEAVREQLRIMLKRLEEHYQMIPVIYSTEEVWEAYLKDNFDEYPLWIRNVYTKPRIEGKWTFWQYSNRGRLKGYSGDETYIDLNVFCGDSDTWEEWRNQISHIPDGKQPPDMLYLP